MVIVPCIARFRARLANGTLIPTDAKNYAQRVSICGEVNPASVCRRFAIPAASSAREWAPIL
jgi:hypothetical protein